MISGFDFLPHCPHGVNTSRQPCMDCANGIGRADGWTPNFNPKTAAPPSASYDPSRWSAGGGGYAPQPPAASSGGHTGGLDLNGPPPKLMQPSPVVNAAISAFIVIAIIGITMLFIKVIPMMYNATIHSYARRIHIRSVVRREPISWEEALQRAQADGRRIGLPAGLVAILAAYLFMIVL